MGLNSGGSTQGGYAETRESDQAKYGFAHSRGNDIQADQRYERDSVRSRSSEPVYIVYQGKEYYSRGAFQRQVRKDEVEIRESAVSYTTKRVRAARVHGDTHYRTKVIQVKNVDQELIKQADALAHLAKFANYFSLEFTGLSIKEHRDIFNPETNIGAISSKPQLRTHENSGRRQRRTPLPPGVSWPGGVKVTASRGISNAAYAKLYQGYTVAEVNEDFRRQHRNRQASLRQSASLIGQARNEARIAAGWTYQEGRGEWDSQRRAREALEKQQVTQSSQVSQSKPPASATIARPVTSTQLQPETNQVLSSESDENQVSSYKNDTLDTVIKNKQVLGVGPVKGNPIQSFAVGATGAVVGAGVDVLGLGEAAKTLAETGDVSQAVKKMESVSGEYRPPSLIDYGMTKAFGRERDYTRSIGTAGRRGYQDHVWKESESQRMMLDRYESQGGLLHNPSWVAGAALGDIATSLVAIPLRGVTAIRSIGKLSMAGGQVDLGRGLHIGDRVIATRHGIGEPPLPDLRNMAPVTAVDKKRGIKLAAMDSPYLQRQFNKPDVIERLPVDAYSKERLGIITEAERLTKYLETPMVRKSVGDVLADTQGTESSQIVGRVAVQQAKRSNKMEPIGGSVSQDLFVREEFRRKAGDVDIHIDDHLKGYRLADDLVENVKMEGDRKLVANKGNVAIEEPDGSRVKKVEYLADEDPDLEGDIIPGDSDKLFGIKRPRRVSKTEEKLKVTDLETQGLQKGESLASIQTDAKTGQRYVGPAEFRRKDIGDYYGIKMSQLDALEKTNPAAAAKLRNVMESYRQNFKSDPRYGIDVTAPQSVSPVTLEIKSALRNPVSVRNVSVRQTAIPSSRLTSGMSQPSIRSESVDNVSSRSGVSKVPDYNSVSRQSASPTSARPSIKLRLGGLGFGSGIGSGFGSGSALGKSPIGKSSIGKSQIGKSTSGKSTGGSSTGQSTTGGKRGDDTSTPSVTTTGKILTKSSKSKSTVFKPIRQSLREERSTPEKSRKRIDPFSNNTYRDYFAGFTGQTEIGYGRRQKSLGKRRLLL